jgi:enamine deaminase RidA (YjgF/YER057c/UK114 family)
MHILQPSTWDTPSGYSNGVAARGTVVFVAGQIGWDERRRIVPGGFVPQVERALQNIAAVLAEAGARPGHVARMTWYVLDTGAYVAAQREIGRVYRAVFEDHYPAMTLVEVAGLLEPGAVVEIEATAVVPD